MNFRNYEYEGIDRLLWAGLRDARGGRGMILAGIARTLTAAGVGFFAVAVSGGIFK